MKEKKARVEDALHATRAAVEEGIVPGGGVALLRVQDRLSGVQAEGDERFGVEIVRRAIEEPLRVIAGNAGFDASIAVDRVKNGQGAFGLDAATGDYGDMLALGIIDPTKVTRSALVNASSVAGLLLTTEAMIAEAPKKEEDAPAGGHGHAH
jgi:chaperonin GroEL